MKRLNLTIPSIEEPFLLLSEDKKKWITEDNKLEIELNKSESDAKILEKDASLSEINDKDIIEFFLEKYIEVERNYHEQEVSGIENTEEENSEIVPKPDFEPERITIRTQVFTIFQIVNQMLVQGKERIDLSPDFQRLFVWKEVEKKSRLIESLLLRIPLPVFYLAEDNEGFYQVVDGVQRLTTIRDFVNNQFRLKDLEYLGKNCGNKTFEELSFKYQSRLQDTQLTFNVIEPQTPPSVKTEIFKRLNLGGKPLNRQEIRNSLSKPKTRDFIRKMAESDEFKSATNNSIKPLRMDDQELVMRYVAFYFVEIQEKAKYKGEMDNFLDDILDRLNNHTKPILFETIAQDFSKSMKNCEYLFTNYAFRKILNRHLEKNQKPPINKSLFTVWSVLMTKYEFQDIQDKVKEKTFVNILANHIEQDKEYFEALSTGTNQLNKLTYSFRKAKEIIKFHLENNA